MDKSCRWNRYVRVPYNVKLFPTEMSRILWIRHSNTKQKPRSYRWDVTIIKPTWFLTVEFRRENRSNFAVDVRIFEFTPKGPIWSMGDTEIFQRGRLLFAKLPNSHVYTSCSTDKTPWSVRRVLPLVCCGPARFPTRQPTFRRHRVTSLAFIILNLLCS